MADLRCLGEKKDTLVPKCVFLGLKPLSKAQNFEKCAKLFFIHFWDISLGYVHQFGVISGDSGATKGAKICQKLSKKGENVYLSS